MGENKIDKKKLILDTMQKLMIENQAKDVSINDIAKNANIAKGSVYYYFNSKDEIFDAVIERSYTLVLEKSLHLVNNPNINAIEKMKLLFYACVLPENDTDKKNYLRDLNLNDSPTLHQKLLFISVKVLTPILEDIISQGINEGLIHTENANESAEMIISVLTFFLDRALFPYDDEKLIRKLKLLSKVLEASMETPKGSFDFLYNIKG